MHFQKLTYRLDGEKGKTMETATIYIIRTEDHYRMDKPATVSLTEPQDLSRTWYERLIVELPEDFRVGCNIYGEPLIYRDSDGYDLHVDRDGNPVIIDHTARGKYIPLAVISVGWDAD